MPQFTYRARNAQGGLVEGVLDCPDRAVAIRQIELQECIPIRIELAAAEAKDRAKIEQAIARHDLFIGMTPEQCVQSRGEPDSINVTTTDRGRHEQWVYRDRRYWVSSQAAGSTVLATVNDGVAEGWRYLSPCYVYFDNGILTAIQDSQ